MQTVIRNKSFSVALNMKFETDNDRDNCNFAVLLTVVQCIHSSQTQHSLNFGEFNLVCITVGLVLQTSQT